MQEKLENDWYSCYIKKKHTIATISYFIFIICVYSGNIIRKAENQDLNIVCQTLID
jgi:hypothetical protein